MQDIAHRHDRLIGQQIRLKDAPALFAGNGYQEKKFWEFFLTRYRNKHTQLAYQIATYRFAHWMEVRGVSDIADVEPMMVAAYVTHMESTHSAPSIKQHLTAIRQLFDFLVINQVITMNPAGSVKAPRHVVKKGKTPVLTADEMRKLFKSIDVSTSIGLRDRAMIAVMAYSFARVSAMCKLKHKHYYTQSKRGYFLLDEKGGVQNKIPAHHTAQLYVDEYLTTFVDVPEPNAPLFQSFTKNMKSYTGKPMNSNGTLRMVKRRCRNAGLPTDICNHSFRGTGITNYMANGGTLETAAKIAGHASTTTTQLYDRRDEETSLDEIERILY